MTLTTIIMQLILVGLSAFGISALMEYYKKTIRKDKASATEIRIIAGVLSVLAAVGFKLTGIYVPTISAVFTNASTWFDALVYAIVIFFVQYKGDMSILKTILSAATEKLVNEGDFTVEVKRLITEFETNTKTDAKELASALKILGVTDEQVKNVLNELGVEATKANEIITAFEENK